MISVLLTVRRKRNKGEKGNKLRNKKGRRKKMKQRREKPKHRRKKPK